MEKLEVGEVALLEDGKGFICCSRVEDGGIDYLYLMSNFKPLEIRFAKQEIVNGEIQLTIIGDTNEKIKLLNLFQDRHIGDMNVYKK